VPPSTSLDDITRISLEQKGFWQRHLSSFRIPTRISRPVQKFDLPELAIPLSANQKSKGMHGAGDECMSGCA
jgi:hypothetical protein